MVHTPSALGLGSSYLFSIDPLADVGWTIQELNAPLLGCGQEANDFQIHERDGPDLSVANELKEVVGGVRVPGMADLAVYRAMGQPNLLITPDRAACSRYGLNVGDLNGVVDGTFLRGFVKSRD